MAKITYRKRCSCKSLVWKIVNTYTSAKLFKEKRKKRIAKGAGRDVQEINALLKQFEQMSKMMKMVQSGGASKLMGMMQNFKQ